MRIENLKNSKTGFTLIELMIVVSILGIMAAIVLPEFQSHSQKAKEAAAKDNLRILREAIDRYAIEHNDIPPGYPLNDTSATPTIGYVAAQLVFKSTNAKGQLANIGTAGYPYGPYLPKFPENPFNNKNTISVLANTGTFPTASSSAFGWVYKPATKEIRIYTIGTDSDGKSYSGY